MFVLCPFLICTRMKHNIIGVWIIFNQDTTFLEEPVSLLEKDVPAFLILQNFCGKKELLSPQELRIAVNVCIRRRQRIEIIHP